MTIARIFLSNLLNVTVYGALLFVPAWTLSWTHGWVLLASVFAILSVTRFTVLNKSEGLLAERRKSPFQIGQPFADKLLVVAFLIVIPIYIAFIPLDVFRFHLLEKPTLLPALAGLIIFLLGSFVIVLAFRENTFAAGIVKHQSERGQTVVDTGVYGVLRHPVYAGTILVLIGVALWLQSYAALVLSIIPATLVILRIFVEERFLQQRLPAYANYTKRVRHRLIPRVW